MRAAGASFRVTKNRLAQRALDGTPFARIVASVQGPDRDRVLHGPDRGAARSSASSRKKNEKLQIVGGGLGGTLLDAASVRALAELPSLDELRGKLIGLLNAPASRLVGLLQAPGGAGGAGAGGAGRAAGRLSRPGYALAPGRWRALVTEEFVAGVVGWRIWNSWSRICRA